MSEARSLTNIIGNTVATIFIANNEGDFDRSKYEKVLRREAQNELSAYKY